MEYRNVNSDTCHLLGERSTRWHQIIIGSHDNGTGCHLLCDVALPDPPDGTDIIKKLHTLHLPSPGDIQYMHSHYVGRALSC